MDFKERVGSRLKSVREALELTTVDVVKQVPFSINTLSGIERAKVNPALSAVSELCQLYDISLDTLVYGSDREFEILLDDLRGVRVDKAILQKQLQELKHLYLG